MHDAYRLIIFAGKPYAVNPSGAYPSTAEI
jgi:hypothetical protein